MPNESKPERAQHTPLQATTDTLGSAGQPVERTLEGPSGRPSLPPTTPDTPPELANLQGYEIVKELGRGGMGVVYLARNTLIDRPEVLKVMSKALVGRPEAVERFLREIRSAGQLIHGNVATAYSAHQLGDLLVLAMEYVEGDDLAKVVRQRGPLPVAHACYCVHQAATALQRGCELGMVHRDIKPSNILLAKQGKRQVVKVIDFGLAKAKSEVTGNHDLTGTDMMMGTPGYSAPEQLHDAKAADTRSDIYALGCTLYYLLAGEPPFRGASALAVAMAQQAGAVRPLRELRPEVPEGLARVVARMMAREPAGRYGQPGEVAAALLPFVQGAKGAPGGPGEGSRAGPKPGRPASPPPDAPATLLTGLQARPRPAGANAGGEAAQIPFVEEVKEAPDGRGEVRRVGAKPGRPVVSPQGDSPSGLQTRPRPAGADAGAKKSRARRDALPVRRWPRAALIGAAAAGAAVALIVAAGVVIKLSVKSAAGDALLVVEVDEPNPDVYVDGRKVTVTWDAGGQRAEIAVKPGTHQVKVKKTGFEADGETVTLSDGGRKVLTASLSRSPPESADAPDNAVPQTAIKPVPPGIGAAARKVYLSDLDEMNWSGCAAFGKNGRSPVADIAVNGVRFPKGLWTHPPAGGYSTVQYRLSDFDAASFVTKVAINDSAGDAAGALLTFQVLGDGKVLWAAAPMRATRQTQECRIGVKDVRVLELRVHCPNNPAEPVPGRPGHHGAHAVWLDPYLLVASPPRATSEKPLGKKDLPPTPPPSEPRKPLAKADLPKLTESDPQKPPAEADLPKPSASDPQKPLAKPIVVKPPARDPAKATSDVPGENPVAAATRPIPGDTSPARRDVVRVRPKPLDCTGTDGVSADAVRRSQEAWAKYLGREVQANVDIGNGVILTFVLVPPGKFNMGSPPDEKGRYPNENLHEVTLTEPFDLTRYVVTQTQYKALTGLDPSFFKGPNRPVERVTWHEADEFGSRLTKKLSDGTVYRLPTEAEWEYSCRAGRPNSLAFGVGDGRTLTWHDANFNNNVRETTKVDAYPPNALGLYDMNGNAIQWCADWGGDYANVPVTDPLSARGQPYRVARGGCFCALFHECRSAFRLGSVPERRDFGFRLARTIPSTGK